MELYRFAIKIAGASGMGIDSAGKIMARTLKNSGYHIFAYREYPSLIKGGHSFYQIDIANQPINSSSKYSNIVICLERASIHAYLSSVAVGGYLLHNLTRVVFSDEEKKIIQERQIHVEFIDCHDMMMELGGLIFTNIFFLGLLCKLIGIDTSVLKELVKQEFADKPKLVDLDIKAIDLGVNYQVASIPITNLGFAKNPNGKDFLLLTGNEAISLGAINAGVRAFFGYPMTPASSILTYLAETYHETGMLIKQAEDEITAAQMALGAMFMGTRALTATSGGGFDLMTETVSLSGITETPFVCILGQRPGPATGVPTGTAASDLNLAIYSAHGELPRYVIAASDAISAFKTIQYAFNIAEKYQIPVIVLTEKQIAESLFSLDSLPGSLAIDRGLLSEAQLQNLQASDRFKDTPSGISPRWLPSQSPAAYLGNSDEHLADGSLTEDPAAVKLMIDKRMRKLEGLKAELEEPVLYGAEVAETILVGWGSVKTVVMDALNQLQNPKIAYLHYQSIWPLKTEKLKQLASRRLVMVENNYFGQLGNLITQETGIKFSERLLRYDSRPFFIEDILDYLQNLK